jgi:hypothetical protein
MRGLERKGGQRKYVEGLHDKPERNAEPPPRFENDISDFLGI